MEIIRYYLAPNTLHHDEQANIKELNRQRWVDLSWGAGYGLNLTAFINGVISLSLGRNHFVAGASLAHGFFGLVFTSDLEYNYPPPHVRSRIVRPIGAMMGFMTGTFLSLITCICLESLNINNKNIAVQTCLILMHQISGAAVGAVAAVSIHQKILE